MDSAGAVRLERSEPVVERCFGEITPRKACDHYHTMSNDSIREFTKTGAGESGDFFHLTELLGRGCEWISIPYWETQGILA